MIFLWSWCNPSLVLVSEIWSWCGSGAFLVWLWCDPSVVLMWSWCVPGVVRVWSWYDCNPHYLDCQKLVLGWLHSGTYRRVFLFHQNCVPDRTKIQGHTGGSFFFTRIVSPTIPKFRDIQEGLSFSPEFWKRNTFWKYKQSSPVLTIRPQVTFCHRQRRG